MRETMGTWLHVLPLAFRKKNSEPFFRSTATFSSEDLLLPPQLFLRHKTKFLFRTKIDVTNDSFN